MSCSATYIAGSVEYLKVQVSADVDLTDDTLVEIKLDDAWLEAAWVGDEAKSRVAEVLVDFGTLTAAQRYKVYVRLTDIPETPILYAGQISVSV